MTVVKTSIVCLAILAISQQFSCRMNEENKVSLSDSTKVDSTKVENKIDTNVIMADSIKTSFTIDSLIK